MNFFKALFGSSTNESPEKNVNDERNKDFDVLKYDGVRALRMGQAAYAVQCFTHALEINDDLESRDYLSQALIRTGDLQSAVEQLRTLADAQPDNVRILVTMAHVLYMMEDYEAMLAACERAKEVNQGDPQVLYFCAKAHIGLGQQAEAVALLTDAIAEDANYADAYLLRGTTLLEMGQTESARADADYLLAHVSDNEDVLILAAKVAKAEGNLSEALSIYNKVIDINPFCAPAFRNRSELRWEMGDEAGANDDISSLMAIDPNAMNGEDIQQKVEEAYRNSNPFGLG